MHKKCTSLMRKRLINMIEDARDLDLFEEAIPVQAGVRALDVKALEELITAEQAARDAEADRS